MSYDEFFAEVERRESALETARVNKAADPDGYRTAAREYGVWRREIRLLGGRPFGSPPFPPEVVAFMRNNPDDPRTVAAVGELRASVDALIGD